MEEVERGAKGEEEGELSRQQIGMRDMMGEGQVKGEGGLLLVLAGEVLLVLAGEVLLLPGGWLM